MDATFRFPSLAEELQLYRDILVARPLPQHLRRKRNRTMSLGHGECRLERDSQRICGRVQGTDFAQTKPPRNALSPKEPSLNEIPTEGLSGRAFIRAFPAKTWVIALDLATRKHGFLHNSRKGVSTPDVDSSAPNTQTPTSKYTADQCAERKARKKERRAQEKQQNKSQETALPVLEEAGAMSDAFEQVPSPASLAAKKKSRRGRRGPPAKQSHEPPQQIDITQTAAMTTHGDIATSPPTIPSPAPLCARTLSEDLTSSDTADPGPWSLVFLVIILWTMTSTFYAQEEIALDLRLQSGDSLSLIESDAAGMKVENGLSYQNFTMEFAQHPDLRPPKSSSALSKEATDINSYAAELWDLSTTHSESTLTSLYMFTTIWFIEMGNVNGFHIFPLRCRNRHGDLVSQQIVWRQAWYSGIIAQLISVSSIFYAAFVAGYLQ